MKLPETLRSESEIISYLDLNMTSFSNLKLLTPSFFEGLSEETKTIFLEFSVPNSKISKNYYSKHRESIEDLEKKIKDSYT